ncbi:putative nuclease HARBI1 [Eupeodes corollae]|uniref:putative nuclease HARBI1 n=1 Tax=Eupeodes corollae TaxID=290404 RepID=UPI002492C8D1|nr:putative nuclease HARBI1 [Eupeodes corollae]
MFFHCDYFLESEDESESEGEMRVTRALLRDSSDPMSLSSSTFKQLFRLNKEAFKYVLDEIDPHLPSFNSTYIPNVLKLAATLRFLAEGGYQRGTGQDFLVSMAQPTLSVTLAKILPIMENILCPKFISFAMTEDEKTASKQHFYEKYSFPGIIGCVDGTHIKIIRPVLNEHLYFNRKGDHSINAMIVCDYKMRIRAIDARYGGASHDSFVFSLSAYRRHLVQKWNDGDRRSWLLGDSGYTLEPWMMTPYRSAQEGGQEEHFNTIHSKCRNIVERTIGVLKSRFRSILGARQLHYSPEKAIQITNVCAALHNICKKFAVPDFPVMENNEEGEESELVASDLNQFSNIATEIRNQIKDVL